MRHGPWDALLLEVPSELADELCGALAGHSLGAQLSPAGPGRDRLTIYFRDAEVLDAAATALGAHGLDPDACGLRVERVEDGHWVERYQASLRPFRLGAGFTVLPSVGGAVPRGGRRPIVLVPGRAFGTGEHATTQLCVERLERWVAPGSRWLDVGCGTAILAIVAQRCGAAEVLALDSDPLAVEVAEQVLRTNRVGIGVRLRRGEASDAAPHHWDGVVVNISAAFFERSADELARALAPGGRVVASGFVVDDASRVAAALEAAGLREVERVSRGCWSAQVVQRR